MSELTIFAGLEALEPGEPITTDGSQFTGRDRVTIDQWLSQVPGHRHTGNAAISNPTDPMTIVGLSSGGTIPTDTQVFVTFTVVDAFGGETAAAPEATATTPPGIGEPASALTCTIDNSHGQLTVNSYQYVYTLTDATGGESEIGPPVTVDRLPGAASATAVFSGMLTILAANPTATGWRQYRSTGGSQYCLLGAPQGMVDGFVDDGTLPVDYGTQPPADDTTNQAGALSATLPPGAAAAGASFNVYVSLQSGTYTSPSLYGSFPASEAGSPIVITSVAAQDGSPPPVATTVRGAHQIDPDSELLDWHWKRPVATVAALPSGGQGDVRLVYGASAIYGVLGAGAVLPADWTELVNPGGGGGGSASIVVLASGGLGAFVTTAGDTIVIHLGESPDADTPFDPAFLQSEVNALAAAEGYLASGVSGLGLASGLTAVEISILSAASGTQANTEAWHQQEIDALAGAEGYLASAVSGLGTASAATALHQTVQDTEITILGLASGLQASEISILGLASAAASAAITSNSLRDVAQDAELVVLMTSSASVAAHQTVQDAEITALAAASALAATTLSAVGTEIVILGGASANALTAITWIEGQIAKDDAELGILASASGATQAHQVVQDAELTALSLASTGFQTHQNVQDTEIVILSGASAAASAAITANALRDNAQDAELIVLMAASGSVATHQAVQDAELTALALASTGMNAEVVVLMAASAGAGSATDALARAEIAILGTASAAASALLGQVGFTASAGASAFVPTAGALTFVGSGGVHATLTPSTGGSASVTFGVDAVGNASGTVIAGSALPSVAPPGVARIAKFVLKANVNNTDWTLTHGLGTRQVIVGAQMDGGSVPGQPIDLDWTPLNPNQITVNTSSPFGTGTLFFVTVTG